MTTNPRNVCRSPSAVELDRVEAEMRATGVSSLPLPRVGITLLAPWWWYILWAGKRVENRTASVVARMQGWTGLCALTTSKMQESTWDDTVDKHDATRTYMRKQTGVWPWDGPERWTGRDSIALGGHVVGVIEVLGTRPNESPPYDLWATLDGCGILIGRVLEVEPIACSGGRGVFMFGACKGCGKPGALDTGAPTLRCRACKLDTPRAKLGRPALKVTRVMAAGAYT